MTKADFIAKISEASGVSKKDADAVIKAFAETAKDALVAGDTIAIPGFGTFSVTERSAREGINPLTKEKIQIPASKAAKFKASSLLKDTLNK